MKKFSSMHFCYINRYLYNINRNNCCLLEVQITVRHLARETKRKREGRKEGRREDAKIRKESRRIIIDHIEREDRKKCENQK